jgi:hypothetical protein
MNDQIANAGETIQLTEQQFRWVLAQMAENAGYKADLAAKLGVSAQFLGTVISGRKRPGRKLLKALGASVERMYTMPVSVGNGIGNGNSSEEATDG